LPSIEESGGGSGGRHAGTGNPIGCPNSFLMTEGAVSLVEMVSEATRTPESFV
jgi:hypothetical protein